MSIFKQLAGLIGLRGLSAASDVLLSPWSDSTYLEQITFDSLYGIGVQGCTTRSAAIRLAAVAAGRDVLTGRVSRCPLVEYTAADGRKAPRSNNFLTQPERGLPLSQTITWTLDDLFFNGRAYWQVVSRYADGFPAFVNRVPLDQAETDDAGQLVKAFGKPVDPADGIRIDGPHEGLLSRGAETIRRATRLNRAAAKAENNPVPSLDLHNEGEDLNSKEIAALLSSWNKARETSGVGYSSKSLKVTALGQPSEQLMIDGRKAINLELARHMGAGGCPEIVGVAIEGASLTYANRASREASLIDNFLAPYITAIEDRLSMDDLLPHGRKVRFDTDVLTRDDTATRYANYKTAKELDLLTDEEIRAAEGLPPKTGN